MFLNATLTHIKVTETDHKSLLTLKSSKILEPVADKGFLDLTLKAGS